MNKRELAKSAIRNGVPAALIAAALRPGASRLQRIGSLGALVAFWGAVYSRYRKGGKAQTHQERELLKNVSWEAFWRHYNEQVPTIEEEFELWGAYHQHRHEMRYDLVADEVRKYLPAGGRVLDVGCGSALVADRIRDIDATYVGFDFGGHHIEYAAKKYADITDRNLRTVFARGDAQKMPFADRTVDVVVFSEVIEHLLQPELAVWEITRVLKPGGVLVMTTNNASEVPLRSPLSHLFAWLEKAFGADHPELISLRPWVWPWPVDRELLPEGSPDVYLPHTHHIMAETKAMFAAAGLDTFEWSTFEFPPPQAASAQWLDKRGPAGRKAVDVIEWAAQRTPLVRRLGCHVFMRARKIADPVARTPPPGIWPGPFSEGN
ncbi:MAG TPA: class I SAM-dependent methyltransferase [Actinomycetota bacterium]|nr:class I SAM-dependent methyltransferase [Actinomycetota bacterium]